VGNRVKTVVARLAMGLIIGACNYSQSGPSPNVLPSETIEAPELPVSGVPSLEPTRATLQLAVYPPEARTGIEALDAIIDAVLAHDADRLRGLTRFTRAACTQENGLGGPPQCEPGETEGSVVDVVPLLGPEGHHMRYEAFMQWPGPDVRGLLAVYGVSSEIFSAADYPAGEDAIVFLNADGVTTLTLQVVDGKVVRFDTGAGEMLEQELAHRAASLILPLAFNPIPTAVPWPQYDDTEGRFAFVYPPTMTISPDPGGNGWRLGDQIEFFVARPGRSWVACFDQALGDCPVVDDDRIVEINGAEVRRVKGWMGAVGGRTPQEFIAYIFDLKDERLVFALYALPFDTVLSDSSRVWPVEGMALDLFEHSVATVVLHN